MAGGSARPKVPILLAGESGGVAAATLNGLGMACEMVGETIGQAGEVKMIRSMVVKGVEAMLIRTLIAEHRVGPTERTLDSMNQTLPLDWRARATFYFSRTQAHGARRASEASESAAKINAAHDALEGARLPVAAVYSDYLVLAVNPDASLRSA